MARRRSVLGKIVLGLAVLAILFVLFLRTLRETTSAPYQLPAAHLTGWELALDPPLGPGGPLLALLPPRELPMGLFQEVFARTMESMNPPAGYAVSIILRGEFSDSLAGVVTPAELLELARAAGLDDAAIEARCLAVQQGMTGGPSDRAFFALFHVPALGAYRESVGRLADERGGGRAAFDPEALAPAIYLAATGGGFRGWPVADGAAEQHCVAPLEVAPEP